ncbi:hypothetical protein PV04_05156 [Phialophora macrospora]|uniref:Phytocyanin domain-containing protein n=1 Tax=Phialophora macrospora TaxID=1851006 RepID=A0A0D2FMA6_9EURO|nr:hypothetical protein PV04_05156 [Phialophora macrospora]
MRLWCLLFAALLPSALAQDSTTTTDFFATTSTTAADSSITDSGTSTSTTAPAFTTTIAVGGTGHYFTPDVVQVPVGGFVEFDFYPTNHSVIRAEYLSPCVPYEMTGIGKVGFYSGFHPVDAILSNPPRWTLQIKDSDPIFFYCGAPNSCIGYQMVGVINPNASVSLEIQKEYAANSSFMLLPGEPWPDESNPYETTSTSTATAIYTTSLTATWSPTPTTASTSVSAPPATATSEPSESHSSKLSTGAIAGIAIGGAAVVLAAAGLLFFCGRRSRRQAKSQQPTGPATPAMGPTHPPAYVPPPANYGYMSPSNKHMSMTAMPVTDAFGNPIQNGGPYGGGGGYPQGFIPPAMQQVPHMMGNPHPYAPQPSPSADIFGTVNPPPGQHMHDTTQPSTEVHSLRASSPSSMHAAPAPVVGGIEAFLQRQGRMSPQPENEAPGDPVYPHGVGPYEMAATGTHLRQS